MDQLTTAGTIRSTSANKTLNTEWGARWMDILHPNKARYNNSQDYIRSLVQLAINTKGATVHWIRIALDTSFQLPDRNTRFGTKYYRQDCMAAQGLWESPEQRQKIQEYLERQLHNRMPNTTFVPSMIAAKLLVTTEYVRFRNNDLEPGLSR